MPMRDALLPEFDHEMAVTRKMLERVPLEKFDWQPHAKSMSLGKLSCHLAEIPGWVSVALDQDSFDVEPVGGSPYETPKCSTSAALLGLLDGNVTKGRASIGAIDDASFMKPWDFLRGGNLLFRMPKVVVLRNFVLNHNVHHRAQLGVYLRLIDVPVPAVYGPSADDAGM